MLGKIVTCFRKKKKCSFTRFSCSTNMQLERRHDDKDKNCDSTASGREMEINYQITSCSLAKCERQWLNEIRATCDTEITASGSSFVSGCS